MIEIKNICKKYQNVNALDNVSLAIEDGDYIAIVGESGSGKSTLLYSIGLLESIDSGTIIYDGVDVSNLSEKELAKLRVEKIGFVFQAYNLEESYSVYENVEIPLLIRGKDKTERKAIVNEKLDMVGLLDRAKDKVSTLSGGQQQRVAIARALAGNPSVILADEPCGNLDSRNSHEIMSILGKLNNEGKTIILVTHNLNDAKLAKKIYTMQDGKIGDSLNSKTSSTA